MPRYGKGGIESYDNYDEAPDDLIAGALLYLNIALKER